MFHIRNLVFLAIFAFIIAGCGGGDTAISASNAAGDNAIGTGNPGGTTGTTPTPTPTPTTGTVTLQWVAPTTWIDNSPLSLSEISGYHVYYGTSATDTPNTVNINDGSATQYTITLPTGSYYFRISSISNNGVEGPMSTAIQTTIQ